MHPEQHPSASLWQDEKTGYVKYRDWHQRDGVEFLTLPEVYAALHSGKARHMGASETAVWALRILVDSGMEAPAPVDAPDLPDQVPGKTRQVWEGFLFMLGCRWLYDYGKPAPFTHRFASAWCKISEWQVRDPMRYLLKCGYLREVGKHGTGTNKTTLFLPGSRLSVLD